MAREEKDGNVLSVRLSSKEMAALKAQAARDGGRVSDVVREALDNYTSRRQESAVQWGIPENSRVFMYQGGPARSESLNPSEKVGDSPVKESEGRTSRS